MSSNIKYTNHSDKEIYKIAYNATKSGAYLAYLRGKRCKTDKDFLNEVSASFQFPAYFGENWPALDECLCDLEWLNVSGILVIVDDFSCIFNRDQNTQALLVKYLSIMEQYWEAEGIPIEIILNN